MNDDLTVKAEQNLANGGGRRSEIGMKRLIRHTVETTELPSNAEEVLERVQNDFQMEK